MSGKIRVLNIVEPLQRRVDKRHISTSWRLSMNATSLQTLPAIVFLGWLALSSGAPGQEPREDTLKKLLERYPAADANKDGKLSAEEARAYRSKLTGKSEPDAAAQK